MLYKSGDLGILQPHPLSQVFKAGQEVGGHAHNFGHNTFARSGVWEIEKIHPTKFDANGEPTEWTVIETAVLDADAPCNWVWIEKGCWHVLRAKTDGARYQCVYVHRAPQAVTMDPQGQQPMKPLVMTDADGDSGIASTRRSWRSTPAGTRRIGDVLRAHILQAR
jgi:hypothetical protein